MNRYNAQLILSSRNAIIIYAIITFTSLVLYVSIILLPHYRSYQAFDFVDEMILPEEQEYCPGDRMFFTVTGESEYRGNVDVRRNWCRTGNPSLCPQSLVEIFPSIQPVNQEDFASSRTHRTIPYMHSMNPGETWLYNETVAIPYQAGQESMFNVIFRLADDCPAYNE